MKIHHLNCGTLRPRGGKLFSPEMAVMPCHCLLIETEEGLVLVDAGLGTADLKDPSRLGPMRFVLNLLRDPEEAALKQVQRLGFSAADVRHILITHLDLDHAGGLADFPHARVHLTRAEYDAAMNPRSFREHNGYRQCHFAHGPQWVPHEVKPGDTWFGLDCIRDMDGLPPQIVMVPLPGHTRGHCGVAVETDDGNWLFHCGDAYDLAVELRADRTPPFAIRIFQRVAHEGRKTAEKQKPRINGAVAAGNGCITAFSTHDPSEYETLSGKNLPR